MRLLCLLSARNHVVPALAKSLEDACTVVRESAADALDKVDGAHLAPAVPALTRCLEGESEALREMAAEALSKVTESATALALATQFLMLCTHIRSVVMMCTHIRGVFNDVYL